MDYALVLEKKTQDIFDQITAAEMSKAALPAPGSSSADFLPEEQSPRIMPEYRIAEKGEKSINRVFLIDPPLDLARFYNAWATLINSSCPEIIISESEFIKTYIERSRCERLKKSRITI